jgi:hypothetical protein
MKLQNIKGIFFNKNLEQKKKIKGIWKLAGPLLTSFKEKYSTLIVTCQVQLWIQKQALLQHEYEYKINLLCLKP